MSAGGFVAAAAETTNVGEPVLNIAIFAGFVAITVAITVFGGVLYGVADRAADDLVDRTPYLESVFGDRVVE